MRIAAPAPVGLSPAGAAIVRLTLEIKPPYHIFSTIAQIGSRSTGPNSTTVALKPGSLFVLAGALGQRARAALHQRHPAPDWQTRLVPPIEGLAAAFPEGTGAFVYFSRLIGAVEAQAPAAMPALVERIAASPNSRVRELAMKRRAVLTALAQPLDLVFTALDGRSIDTKQWRGRVVLVDFWATWCVPCLKEMPNVRAAYQKYHDKGFEVIGIAFEKAPSPRAVPMERTAEQLVQFARENAMPRPHHYDGKYWENEFGRLVTTDTHGDKLDVAVRRLLAAP